MVTKEELNIIVTKLRGTIRKGIVRTISKLVKKIKSFEHGKQKNPENKKLDIKVKKFAEEIEELKKMHKAAAMKKIFLFNNKETVKVMAKSDATAEQRAIAKLLFLNESLVKSINDFKKKFNLSDDDAEWKEEFLQMGKSKKKVKKQKKPEGDTEDSPKKKKKQKKNSTESPKKKEKKDSAESQEEEVPETKLDSNSSPKKQKKNKNKTTPKDREEKLLKINPKSKELNEKAKDVVVGKKKQNKDLKQKFNGKAAGKPAFAKNPQNGAPKKPKKDFKANQKGGKKQFGGKSQAKKKLGN